MRRKARQNARQTDSLRLMNTTNSPVLVPSAQFSSDQLAQDRSGLKIQTRVQNFSEGMRRVASIFRNVILKHTLPRDLVSTNLDNT